MLVYTLTVEGFFINISNTLVWPLMFCFLVFSRQAKDADVQ